MCVVANNPPLFCTVAGIAALLHGVAIWALVSLESNQLTLPMVGESFKMVVLDSDQTQDTQAKPKSAPPPEKVEVKPISQPKPAAVPQNFAIKKYPPPEEESVVTPEPPLPEEIVQIEIEEEVAPVEEEIFEPLPEESVAEAEIDKLSPDIKSPEFVVESRKARTLPRSDAAYLNNTKPSYPVIARRRRLEGVVLLEVTVEPDGYPSLVDIKESSGHWILDDAARGAVEDWRFVPAEKNGRVITAKVDVPIRFSLK